MSPNRPRLSAVERRAALLDTALGVFEASSYRGVTTAQIAAAAGVTEPVLYQHFDSKRALYLACLEEAWRRARGEWDEIRTERPPTEWFLAIFGSLMERTATNSLVGSFWIQALTEASDDLTIRRRLRQHLQEVHDELAAMMKEAQAKGAVLAERDPQAETWVFMSLGLLASIGRRLGGLLQDDLPSITAARREWLYGEPPPTTDP